MALKPSVIPGFGLTLGFTLAYLSLIVLIPLWRARSARRRRSAERLLAASPPSRARSPRSASASAPLIAAVVNVVFGAGRRLGAGALPLSRPALLDAMVDLPFALPTAVAGIALTTLYAPNGWIGQFARRRSASRSPTRRSASSSR